MLSKAASSTIFKVFGTTRPGIEPRSAGPLNQLWGIWKMTGIVTIYFDSKQQTTWFPFQRKTPLSLMYFTIPFCYSSMHCWENYFVMPLRSFVMSLLMSSTPSKWILPNDPLELKKKKTTRCKISWIGRLFQYGNVPLSQELPDAQYTQYHYFSDIAKSLVIIFQTLPFFYVQVICNHSNGQPTIATNFTCSTLISVLLVGGSLSSGVILYLLMTPFELIILVKNVCDMVL